MPGPLGDNCRGDLECSIIFGMGVIVRSISYVLVRKSPVLRSEGDDLLVLVLPFAKAWRSRKTLV